MTRYEVYYSLPGQDACPSQDTHHEEALTYHYFLPVSDACPSQDAQHEETLSIAVPNLCQILVHNK